MGKVEKSLSFRCLTSHTCSQQEHREARVGVEGNHLFSSTFAKQSKCLGSCALLRVVPSHNLNLVLKNDHLFWKDPHKISLPRKRPSSHHSGLSTALVWDLKDGWPWTLTSKLYGEVASLWHSKWRSHLFPSNLHKTELPIIIILDKPDTVCRTAPIQLAIKWGVRILPPQTQPVASCQEEITYSTDKYGQGTQLKGQCSFFMLLTDF